MKDCPLPDTNSESHNMKYRLVQQVIAPVLEVWNTHTGWDYAYGYEGNGRRNPADLR